MDKLSSVLAAGMLALVLCFMGVIIYSFSLYPGTMITRRRMRFKVMGVVGFTMVILTVCGFALFLFLLSQSDATGSQYRPYAR